MSDPIAISTAIATIKNAIDILKALRSADLTLDKAENKIKLAQLYELLAEAKMQIAEIRELLIDSEAKIAELTKSLEFKGILHRIGDAYFEKDENGDPFGDPYCSICVETGKPAIHLIEGKREFTCGACGGTFQERRIRLAQHMRFHN